ncbi:MAG: serine hydrolase domain-containing protein [Pseudomonadota bacterium]
MTLTRFMIAASMAALLTTACSTYWPPPNESAVPTADAAPPMDEALQRNMAAMAQRPGIAELDWRSPKERVAGDSRQRFSLSTDRFPAPNAIERALAYSEEQDGRGLMVWYDGALVASHFDDDIDETTPTATYSMHKSVVAIAILQAIEAGVIESLDDPVSTYLTEWQGQPRGAITLRQLLTHSSGLEHHSLNGPSPKAMNLALSSKIAATALSFEPSEPPGQTFNYNNVNTQLAGQALEAALAKSGVRYSEFLSERLWKPLGNRDAELWLENPGGSARYASGLEAGLEDWLAIGVMLANGGVVDGQRVLGSESLEALLAPSQLNDAYGLSVWRGAAWQPLRAYGPTTPAKVPHKEPYLADNVYYFDGFGGQRVYVVPSRRLVVARTGEVSFTYDDSVIVNELLRGLMSAEQTAALEAYRSDNVASLYQQRFEKLMRESRAGGGLAGYDPLTPLPGSETFAALPIEPDAASWLDADTRQTLTDYLAPRNTQAFFVWQHGKLVMAEYFGDADADSMVISRSLAKPLSVIAVGRALDRGYLKSLDQPAADFFSEWRGTPKEAITVRMLLTMRSGLEPQRPSRDPLDIMNIAYLHPYHTEMIINDYPLVTVPGERYDYSNANGELVAPLLERATGQRYEDWVTREVLEPIGAPGGSVWVNRVGGTAHSGCCALLPAEAWLRLSILLMNDGIAPNGERLLPEGYVDTMHTPTPQNPHTGMGAYVAGNYIENRGAANPDVPQGKNFHSEPYLDRDLYLFDGNGHQVSYHIERHGLIVMRLGKAQPRELQWDNTFLPNTVLRAFADGTGAALEPQPRP